MAGKEDVVEVAEHPQASDNFEEPEEIEDKDPAVSGIVSEAEKDGEESL
jgi:hypothetical protein